MPVGAPAAVQGGAQGRVPGDQQPAVPECTCQGVPRSTQYCLQPRLTEDKSAPVPDCEKDPVPECAQEHLQEGAQEGVLPHLHPLLPPRPQGDLLKGADPELQAGADKEVHTSPQNQVLIRKKIRSHYLDQEELKYSHIYPLHSMVENNIISSRP